MVRYNDDGHYMQKVQYCDYYMYSKRFDLQKQMKLEKYKKH